MVHRDVTLSICGVVVGILLGAGSVLFADQVRLNASTTEDTLTLRLEVYDVDPDQRVNSRAAEETKAVTRKARAVRVISESSPPVTIVEGEEESDTPAKVDNRCHELLVPQSNGKYLKTRRYWDCMGRQSIKMQYR